MIAQTLTISTANNLVCDDELLIHAADEIKVNAVRDGKLVEVYWNQLTDSEKRQIYVNIFNPCGL